MPRKPIKINVDKARLEAEAYITNHPKERKAIERSIAALTTKYAPSI